jgi:hypothetical protein
MAATEAPEGIVYYSNTGTTGSLLSGVTRYIYVRAGTPLPNLGGVLFGYAVPINRGEYQTLENAINNGEYVDVNSCLLYTSPSPRD